MIRRMDVKRCGRCGQTKPVSEFYVNRTRKDGRQSICKQCRSAAAKDPDYRARDNERARQRRLEDPEWGASRTAQAREFSAGNRARLSALKMAMRCTDCGWAPADEAEAWRLVFDHVDPSTKHDDGASEAVLAWWSWERIEAELALCVPRCGSCHARRTWRQRRFRLQVEALAQTHPTLAEHVAFFTAPGSL
jgi:hypothetical protein